MIEQTEDDTELIVCNKKHYEENKELCNNCDHSLANTNYGLTEEQNNLNAEKCLNCGLIYYYTLTKIPVSKILTFEQFKDYCERTSYLEEEEIVREWNKMC